MKHWINEKWLISLRVNDGGRNTSAAALEILQTCSNHKMSFTTECTESRERGVLREEILLPAVDRLRGGKKQENSHI
jgi:hypothetical protein